MDVVGGPDWKQSVLHQSDQHWDSKKSHRSTIKQHLDEAMERNAPIFFYGDWFDAMQGKNDRRGSKSDVRPEYQSISYFDDLVDNCADWIAPYASNIVGWGRGNHETSVLLHNETDLVKRTVEKVNLINGTSILTMGYEGYIVLNFRKEDGSGVTGGKKKVFFTHGTGGGGQASKGVTKTSYRAAVHPDADIVISGHTHKFWAMPEQRVRISDMGRLYTDTQWHLQLGAYKDNYMNTPGLGWEHEKGFSPTTVGTFWTNVRRKKSSNRTEIEVIPEMAL